MRSNSGPVSYGGIYVKHINNKNKTNSSHPCKYSLSKKSKVISISCLVIEWVYCPLNLQN